MAPRWRTQRAQVDSAYQAGEARMFQHILFQVPPSAAPPVDARKHRQGGPGVAAGEDGRRPVRPASRALLEDPGSKVRGGALGRVGGAAVRAGVRGRPRGNSVARECQRRS